MEDLKIRVNSEAESEEAQCLFFELGYRWLRDMVVLKRNDISDATHENTVKQKLLKASSGWYIFNTLLDVWEWNGEYLGYQPTELKPITKEPVMKEFLNKLTDGTYKLVLLDSVANGVDGLIEVPEGADTLAGDSSTRYFWKHGVGEKGNMIIGVGESLTRYSGWTGCKDSADVWLDYVNDDSFKIIWQREIQTEALPFIDDEPKYDPEDIGIAKDCDLDKLAKEYKLRDRHDGETDEDYRYALEHYIDLENYIAKETLSDKVASAEVARQDFIRDLPEFNFEAVGVVDAEFFPDNVNQPSHYNKGGVECIDAIQSSMTHEAFCGYLKGNIQKYIFRYEDKGGLESLLKAQWYLNKMIGIIECSKVKNSED